MATATEAPPSARGSSPDTASRPLRPLAIAMAAMFMAVMDSFIVLVAGPTMQQDLPLSAGELQWVIAGYQIAYAVLLVIGGRLADIYGIRRVFLCGVAIFTVASVACGLAGSAESLIVARVVEGIGAALMVPQVFAYTARLVPEEARPKAMGALGVVIGSATIAGQIIGGILVGVDLFGLGWRAIFWVNVPVGVAIILLAARDLPAWPTTGSQRLDLKGAALLAAALVALSYPVIEGRERGWPAWVWLLLCGSVALGIAFCLVERRTKARGGQPLLDLSLFRLRTFSVGISLVFALYMLLTSYYLALSVAVQLGLGLSPVEAGLVYVPAGLTFLVFGVLAGRLLPRFGRRLLSFGAAVLTVGNLVAAGVLLLGPGLSLGWLIPTLVLQSIGGGLIITQSLGTVLMGIPSKFVGMASGALSTSQQVGGAVGVAVIGTVFFGALDSSSERASVSAAHALGLASLGTSAIAAITFLLVLALPNDRKRER